MGNTGGFGIPYDTSFPSGGGGGQLPIPGQPSPGTTGMQSNQQKLVAMLRYLMQQKQGGGAPGGDGQGPQMTPAVIGGPPPAMTPGSSGGAPGGGQPSTMGNLPMPQSTQPRGGYETPPMGEQMMNKLDPTGAAVYTGIQGMSKLLQDWAARKDQKEHVEAANIAQNLMNAMQSGDTATIHEILNDKNSTKVLNKVYKGWLEKAQDAQEPGQPDDPAVAGFEKGIKDYTTKKAQGGQPQGKPGTQPQPQQQRPQQQNPNIVGGYRLPMAGPAQQAATQTAQNQLRGAQAEGRLSDADLDQAARQKAGLSMTTEQKAAYDAQMKKYEEDTKKASEETQKAALEVQKSQLEVQEQKIKTGAASDEAGSKAIIAKTNLQIALAKLALAKRGGKPSPAIQVKLDSSTSALSIMDNLIAGKGDKDVNTLTNLKKQLAVSGLKDMATSVNEGHLGTSFGASKPEDLKKLRGALADYNKALKVSGQTPDATDESGTDDSGNPY